MKALIDADSLLYKVGFAIEDKTIWNEMDVLGGLEDSLDITYSAELEQSYTTLDTLINNIMFAVDCDECLLVFSGGINLRLSFPVSYKANRKGSRKPEGYNELLQYARDNYETITTDGIEADDLVVYLKTNTDEDYVLCAIDKDVLYQTVGTHYNYHHDTEITVNQFEATKYAYYQTLAGDTSDGYKGAVGIGDKRATKLLADCKTEAEMWKVVVDTYEAKGQTYEEALWTMRLANMHQWDGSSFVYWEPPQALEK